MALSTTTGAAATDSTHPITVIGGTAANYTITDVNGTLTVSKATLTVTADNKSKIYGTANPTLTATTTGFAYTDTISVVGGSPSLTTTATTNSPVGTYPITAAAGNLARPTTISRLSAAR